jgi:hypothetical protein
MDTCGTDEVTQILRKNKKSTLRSVQINSKRILTTLINEVDESL